MRSEFTAGFTDAYRDDLTNMLVIGEELSLVHAPSATVTGIPSQEAVYAEYYGQSVEEFDAETPEGIAARTEAAIGMTAFYGLDARASMQLFASVFEAEFPEGDKGTLLTAEEDAQAHALLSRVRSLVAGGYHTYNRYDFTNNETGESIAITNARIVNEAQVPVARELRVTISDAFLARTLTIGELPTSFEGESTLAVSQSLVPVENEALREAATLFEENGSPEDMAVLTGLFYSELSGAENTEIDGLIARYESVGQSERLRAVLESVRLQAAGARESGNFAISNPETALPSAEELYEYQSLLSQLRA